MSDQFVGEIRAFGFNFAPVGWALCDGQVLPISQNTALFSLLGTNFGGDGKSNFALPNLQGCFPLAPGQGPGLSLYDIGESGGSAMVTLLATEIPAHDHLVSCATIGNSAGPANSVFGGAPRGRPAAYSPSQGAAVPMNPSTVSVTGGSQPHNNMPPYLTLNFCIALQGIFPPRS